MDRTRQLIRTKLKLYDEDTNTQLWHKCRKFMVPLDIFCVVRLLLTRCAWESKPDFFPKDAPVVLISLLQKSRNAEVILTVCNLISVYCNSYSNAKVELVRKNVLFHLLAIVQSSLNPKEEEKRRENDKAKKHHAGLHRLEEELRKREVIENITSILVYFSLGPRPCHDGFIFEGAIRQMADMLDWRKRQLHPTSNKAELYTKQLVLNKTLVASKRELTNDATSCSYHSVFGLLTPDVLAGHSGLELDLYDTTDEMKELHIQDEIQTAGHVIPCSHEDVTDGSAEWADVFIQTVISPCQFWAWIGLDTRDVVTEIGSRLSAHLRARSSTPLSSPPVDGQLVVVGCRELGPYRAYVLDASQDKVQVFALDYGCLRQVTKSDLYPLDESLRAVPPQAVYCQLKGVILPPRSEKITKNVLTLFCNLAGQSSLVGALQEGCLLSLFLTWARSDVVSLAVIALRVLSNLARDPATRSKLGSMGLVTMVMDVCQSVLGRNDADQRQEILERALEVLANLLYENTENKERLVQAKGVETLLQHLCSEDNKECVRLVAAKVLRVFIGHSKLQSFCSSQRNGKIFHSSASPSPPRTKHKEQNRNNTTPQVSSQRHKESQSGRLILSPPVHSHDVPTAHAKSNSPGQQPLSPVAEHKASDLPTQDTPKTVPQGMWSVGHGGKSPCEAQSSASPSPKSMGRGMVLLQLASSYKPGSPTTSTQPTHSNVGSSPHSNTNELATTALNPGASKATTKASTTFEQVETLQEKSEKLEIKEESPTKPFVLYNNELNDPSILDLKGFTLNESSDDTGYEESSDYDKRLAHINTAMAPRVVCDDLATSKNRSTYETDDFTAVAVNDATQVTRGYLQGGVLEMRSDLTHDLRPSTTVSDIHDSGPLSVMCSFLNSGLGGTIYFGLTYLKSSDIVKVLGLNVSRDEREAFRIGMDQAINRAFKPVVVADTYGISFVPVYTVSPRGKQEIIEDRFVIEIKVEGAAEMLYEYDHRCYIRKEGVTIRANSQCIHKKAVEEEEQKHLAEIQYLEREISLRRKSSHIANR